MLDDILSAVKPVTPYGRKVESRAAFCLSRIRKIEVSFQRETLMKEKNILSPVGQLKTYLSS